MCLRVVNWTSAGEGGGGGGGKGSVAPDFQPPRSAFKKRGTFLFCLFYIKFKVKI